jgi:hypothetical protein
MAITDGVVTLRDGYNGTFNVKTRSYGDGSQAFYHVLETRLPPGTDRSGSITTGGTSQQVAAANTSRVTLTFQNTSDTNMYVNDTGASASPTAGYLVTPNVIVSSTTNNQINVYCAITGKSFIATESIIT